MQNLREQGKTSHWPWVRILALRLGALKPVIWPLWASVSPSEKGGNHKSYPWRVWRTMWGTFLAQLLPDGPEVRTPMFPMQRPRIRSLVSGTRSCVLQLRPGAAKYIYIYIYIFKFIFKKEDWTTWDFPGGWSRLGLGAFTVKGLGSIPGLGIKIPQAAARMGQKKKKKNELLLLEMNDEVSTVLIMLIC